MLSTGRIEEKRGGENGLGSGIFLEESRYHLNQVASTPYCTCHLWQRWHRFFLWPKNLHYPLLESLQTMKAFYNPPVSFFIYGISFIENLSTFSSFFFFSFLHGVGEYHGSRENIASFSLNVCTRRLVLSSIWNFSSFRKFPDVTEIWINTRMKRRWKML